MEQLLANALGSMGGAAVGYIFMYILLKHHLEMSSKTIAAVDKLCDKIDELVRSNFALQQNNTESANQASLAYAEAKEYYIKTTQSIDTVKNDTEEIKMIVVRMFDKMGSGIQLGQILLQQGVITDEQLEKALYEQKKYML